VKKIKIFIASPSDVKEEREIAKTVLGRLKRRYKKYFEIEDILWENKPLSAVNPHQDEIDNPSITDIVVVILWSKLGSNLGSNYKGKITQKQPVTGVEWEFEEAKAHCREHGRPHILVYKKNCDIFSAIGDDEQYKKKTEDKNRLDKFMQYWFDNEDGTSKGAVHQLKRSKEEESLWEFEDKLETHLEELIKNHQKNIQLLHTEIDEKIDNLTDESLKAFENQKIKESLQSSKKCAELICQIISLEEKKDFDVQRYNEDSYKFIDKITEKTFRNQERDFVRAYLKPLIFNGKYSSTTTVKLIEMTHENVKLSNISLQRLLNWLFIDYLKRTIPKSLIRYASKYNIFISFNKADKEWVNCLKKNLQAQNYKVYLVDAEKQKSEKRVNQAFEEIKAVILICSAKRDDKNWFKDKHDELKLKQQQKNLNFKIVSISKDKNCSNLMDINCIDFSADYSKNFNALIDEIEGEPIGINHAKIVMPPKDDKCFGIKKSFCVLGFTATFLGIFGFFIFKTYVSPPLEYVEVDFYTASNDRSTYNVIGEEIAKHIAKDVGITLVVKKAAGSYDSLRYLTQSDKNRLTMAIVQADAMQKYISDKKNRGFAKKLKVLAPLYKEEVHFLVREESNLTYFHQIKDLRIDIGKENSGTAVSSLSIYKEMFSDDNNIKSFNMDAYYSNVRFKDALKRLKDGDTDVVVMVAGQPLPILVDEKGMKLLTYDSNLLLKKQKELGLLVGNQIRSKKMNYEESYIRPESYKWNDKYIRTLNTRAYLIVYDDGQSNQKLLEKFTKAYIQNLHKMKNLAIEGKVHQKWLYIPEYLKIPEHLKHKLPSDLSYSQIAKKTWDSVNFQPIEHKH